MKKIIFLLLLLPLLLPAQTKYVFGCIKSSGGSPTPTITRSPSSLTGFSTTEGSASTYQSATVSGSNLTANITVSGTTNWEVSLSAGSGYSGSITLTQSGGTVSSTTVYFRIKATATAGTYTEGSNLTSTGATTQHITLSGTVDEAGGGGDLIVNRILVDIGGNTGFKSGVQTGSTTPEASGADSSGRYWNNKNGIGVSNYTWLSNPVDTAGNPVTGFSLYTDKTFAGTGTSTDSSLNSSNNFAGVLNDYPNSALRDCLFMESGNNPVTWTVHLPAGVDSAHIKVWGARATTGTKRMDFKLGTAGSYGTYWYDAVSPTYDNGHQTITVVDGDQINFQIRSGDANAYISLLDIHLFSHS